MESFGLYVHIPFCVRKCPYCDFNSYESTDIPEERYTAALQRELELYSMEAPWKGQTLHSIYIGGGTPSLFTPTAYLRLMAAISACFPIDHRAEITIEVNPGTVTAESLHGYREARINRLSIGMQSFDPAVIETLERIHTVSQCHNAYELGRAVGFRNISMDLMYAVPGQSPSQLLSDLATAVKLSPEHISAYALTIEEGTPFEGRRRRGLLSRLNERGETRMMESVAAALTAHGYEHYEISNFARAGRESRHNLAYWNGSDYLGLGAGAHSYYAKILRGAVCGGRRWSNTAQPGLYMDRTFREGSARHQEEDIDLNGSIFEYLLVGLRKTAGIPFRQFEERYGFTIKSCYPHLLEILHSSGLIDLNLDCLRLTPRGLLLADTVIANFCEPERAVENLAVGS